MINFRRFKFFLGGLFYRVNQFYIYKKLSKTSHINKKAKLHKVHLKGNIIIKENAKIVGGVYISGNVEIGNYTSINGPNVDLYSKLNKITVGKFCSIARNVSIQEYNHNFKHVSTYLFSKNFFKNSEFDDFTSKGEIIIGNDVWIGAHSVILSGVKIGDGAVIAANSVVTREVPNYSIVGGNPSKFIKYRFDEKIRKELDRIRWWDWSVEKISQNKEVFSGEITLEKLKKIK